MFLVELRSHPRPPTFQPSQSSHPTRRTRHGLTRQPAAAGGSGCGGSGCLWLPAFGLRLGGAGAHVGDVTLLALGAVAVGPAVPILDGLPAQPRSPGAVPRRVGMPVGGVIGGTWLCAVTVVAARALRHGFRTARGPGGQGCPTSVLTGVRVPFPPAKKKTIPLKSQTGSTEWGTHPVLEEERWLDTP